VTHEFNTISRTNFCKSITASLFSFAWKPPETALPFFEFSFQHTKPPVAYFRATYCNFVRWMIAASDDVPETVVHLLLKAEDSDSWKVSTIKPLPSRRNDVVTLHTEGLPYGRYMHIYIPTAKVDYKYLWFCVDFEASSNIQGTIYIIIIIIIIIILFV